MKGSKVLFTKKIRSNQEKKVTQKKKKENFTLSTSKKVENEILPGQKNIFFNQRNNSAEQYVIQCCGRTVTFKGIQVSLLLMH